jgi:hypothetical protein
MITYVSNGFWKDMEGSVVALCKFLPVICLEGLRKTRKISVKMSGLWAET